MAAHLNVAHCCAYLKSESRLLRLVPDKYLSEVAIEAAKYIESYPAAKHNHVKLYLRRWLRQSSLPWWVVLLIKAGLEILVSLLLNYLKPVRFD
jgi:hypothetical protein